MAPSYAGDPLGSGSYPVYRDQEGPGASFPGYADDGPPPSSAYRDPGPPSYRDDPLGGGGAPSYRDPDPALGSGSYREESLPGYRDGGPPYAGDPLGSGPYPAYRDRDPYPPSRDEPGTYPGDHPGLRYADDPFQSVYPDDPRDPARLRSYPGRFTPLRPASGTPGTTGSPRPFLARVLARAGRPGRPEARESGKDRRNGNSGGGGRVASIRPVRLSAPGRIQNSLRGIPSGWSRVVPLAEEATSAPALNAAAPPACLLFSFVFPVLALGRRPPVTPAALCSPS